MTYSCIGHQPSSSRLKDNSKGISRGKEGIPRALKQKYLPLNPASKAHPQEAPILCSTS
jgi:hypothetical protein